MDRTDGQFVANRSILRRFDFIDPTNCTIASIHAILRRFVLTVRNNGQLKVIHTILKRFKIPDIRTIGRQPFNFQTIHFKGAYSDNNTATFTLTNAGGCDSLVTLNLTITEGEIDASVTVNGTELTANASGAAWQWLDCDADYAIIPGEINQTFIPSASGNYAVEITQNNCKDTSACHPITITGISSQKSNVSYVLFPNPSAGQFTLSVVGHTGEDVSVTIYDVLGEKIYEGKLEDKTEINLSGQPEGVYMLHLTKGTQTTAQKLILYK